MATATNHPPITSAQTQPASGSSLTPLDTGARTGNPPSNPPSVTLTPATPESPLATSIPDHAQPMTPPNTVSKASSPPSAMSEKAAATTDGVVSENEKVAAPAPGTSAAPATATASTSRTPGGPPANRTTVRNPTTSQGQKKKRKRKGFAAFLLALGCLSVDDFEDEPGTKEKREQLEAKNAGETGRTAQVQKAAAVPASPVATGSAPTEPTATASTTLVGGQDAGGEAKDVVIPPVEPVILPIDETAGVTSSAVQAPGSGSELLTGTPTKTVPTQSASSDGPTSSVDKTETSGGYSNISDSDMQDESGGQGDESQADYGLEDEYEDEEDRLIAQGGIGIPIDEHGNPAPLLPALDKAHFGRKCLVLDLDETLLHSSFKMLPSADYIVPVEIESQVHNVYVIKRPGVDHFLKEMGKIYEIVVFTASLSKYADPVLDMLDTTRVVRHRLFRESCYNHKGNYVKDLSQLGRSMETAIIIDNSPASYIFHPNNAVPVSTWFNDPHDTELTDLCPFLADLATVDDVRGVLDGSL